MNFYAFSALVNLLTSLSLGTWVLIRNRKDPINRNFFYFCFGVAFWSFGYIFWQFSNNANEAHFWLRWLMVGAAFAPIFYLTFVIHYLDIYKQRLYKILFWLALALDIFFVLADIFSPTIIAGSTPRMDLPYAPVGGSLFIPFLIMFFGYVAYASCLLIGGYKNSTGIRKIQIGYMFVGIVFAFVAGSTNYFLFFDIPIKPYYTILVSLYPISISYAILKYRLMDIAIAVRKGLAYTISLMITLAIYVSAILFLKTYTERLLQIPEILSYSAIIILIACGFPFLKKYFDKFFASLLVHELVEAEDSVQKIFKLQWNQKDETEAKQKLKEFYKTVEKEIQGILPVNTLGFYYRDFDNEHFYKIHDIDVPGPKFLNDTALYRELLENYETIVKDELPYRMVEYPPMSGYYKFLALELDSIGAEIAVPMIFDHELFGFIYAGGKKGKKKVFTSDDIDYLEKIGYEFTKKLIGLGGYFYMAFGMRKP